MTVTYANMTWPDDPYRTSQQLIRRPPPRLAAFTAICDDGRACPTAVVYLPLHRTRPVTITAATLSFGFRAALASGEAADGPALARIADLDLMQARRHAAILAGYQLAAELAPLRAQAGGSSLRGITAVQQEWAARSQPRMGKAAIIDCHLDLTGHPDLLQACEHAALQPGHAAGGQTGAETSPAVLAAERALIIGLLVGRHLGRYQWSGVLSVPALIALAAWDCLPGTSAVLPQPSDG
jgi:hypothetical protein